MDRVRYKMRFVKLKSYCKVDLDFLLRIYGHSRTNFLGESAGEDNSDIKLMIVQQDEIGDSLDAMH